MKKKKDTALGAPNSRKRARKILPVLNKLYDPGEHEINISDMLADLRHLCAVKGIDFYECDRRAQVHYAAERMGEPI